MDYGLRDYGDRITVTAYLMKFIKFAMTVVRIGLYVMTASIVSVILTYPLGVVEVSGVLFAFGLCILLLAAVCGMILRVGQTLMMAAGRG